jgi:uncharacterized protein YbjT (DUF2867 family)
MSTYAVAGVTGRVGSVVATELLARGHRVRGISRDPTRAATWSAQSGGDAAIGSLEDREFLTQTLRDVAGFFTLLPEDPFSPDFHGTRRRMADAVAAAVRDTKVPQVVLLSAVAAMVADGNGPAIDLHYLEAALRSTGTNVTILRASWFQENVGAVVQAAAHAGIYPNLMFTADAAFPTVATRDVGGVAASLLLSPPPASEVVDLIGPAYSARDLALALGNSLGRQLEIIDVPPLARVGALVQAGLPQSFAEEVAELYACFEAGRIRPQGDRAMTATTTIHEVLPNLLASARAPRA